MNNYDNVNTEYNTLDHESAELKTQLESAGTYLLVNDANKRAGQAKELEPVGTDILVNDAKKRAGQAKELEPVGTDILVNDAKKRAEAQAQ